MEVMLLVTTICFIFLQLASGCTTLGSNKAILKQNILDKIKISSVKSESLSELEYLSDTKLVFPELFSALDGSWALIYSNRSPNLMTSYQDELLQRTISKTIPFFSLYTFSNVIQQIDSSSKTIDHILKFDGSKAPIPLPSLQIVLNHDFNVISQSCPATIGLYLTKVKVIINNLDVLSLPLLPIGPKELRGGYFETTYCDEDFRISRGLFDEFRIFKKQSQ